MTSRITRPVIRRTETNLAHYGPDRKPIIVSIEPGDVLGFRLLKRRKTYRILISDAMRYAVQLEATAARRKKKEKK